MMNVNLYIVEYRTAKKISFDLPCDDLELTTMCGADGCIVLDEENKNIFNSAERNEEKAIQEYINYCFGWVNEWYIVGFGNYERSEEKARASDCITIKKRNYTKYDIIEGR